MIACPNCRNELPIDMANTEKFYVCPNCRKQLRAAVFNALHRPADQGRIGEPIQEKGPAECFYHPGKMAKVPCSDCGRLLCALCEIPFDGSTICTNCLQSGRHRKQIQALGSGYVLYDSLALHISFWPLILFFVVSIFTAPVAIFIVLRHWRTPHSILPRSKFRFVLAFLLAGAQLIGWVVLFWIWILRILE